jgi:adenosylhomocysteine nucleosidase
MRGLTMSDNDGASKDGPGSGTITGAAFGLHPLVGSAILQPRGRSGAADVGVLTVLAVESRAVADALSAGRDYRIREAADGLRFHQATLGAARVVALQSLHLGQRSTGTAFEQLREHWAPPVVALVGVAAAAHHSVRPGDVVVSDEVVCYDTRHGMRPRGERLYAPGMIGRRLNAFFTELGEPLRCADQAGEFSVRRGPIGSAAAAGSAPLAGWTDTLLAMETESGGVAQAVHERLDQRHTPAGWLTIRGISGPADAHRDTASRHAAAVLVRLLPYLAVGLPPP